MENAGNINKLSSSVSAERMPGEENLKNILTK
jgi:hypothetical protein